jgi:hypothetical protein
VAAALGGGQLVEERRLDATDRDYGTLQMVREHYLRELRDLDRVLE